VALSLVGASLVAELALRVAGYSPAHVNPLKAFHVADPVIGHRGRPGYEGRFVRPEFDVRVAHDEHGFRRPATPIEADRCDRRVLVYGDSFVWGWGVSEGELLTDRLAVLRPDLCVYNFGINASSTGMQYTLFLHEHAEMLTEGDTVVVIFYANDFNDNVRGQTLQGHIVDGQVQTVVVRKTLTHPARRWLKENSYLVNLGVYASDVWSLKRKRRRDESRARRDVGEAVDSQEAFVTQHYLQSFRDAVEARGASLLVSRVPDDDPTSAPALARIAGDSGIEFYDVADEFLEEASGDGPALCYPVDAHWTPEGHRLMARLLAERL
jgi:lysophospholipase L1-like esterase